ncbi:hypothetical protein OV079_09170 [Nannocystis pusilla]|uniref:Uncharacterized protein n=1 Tax=Nannocystis pusilla TaxID=889268 RepID=A0A9X3EL92_9BACT|nr:hypothetical protein [Nannocystis pusilla]MCY1005731.1 hypothetical protein [Nannocystis pusilla]
MRTAEAFSIHLQEKFSDHTNLEKGDGFVAFACKILPLCDFWGDMPPPEPSPKKTHDRGIDLVSAHPTAKAKIFGQTKFRMREVQDFDGVISKFAAYDKELACESEAELSLFPERVDDGSTYVLVTSSNLGEIRRRYEDSRLPSLNSIAACRRAADSRFWTVLACSGPCKRSIVKASLSRQRSISG